MFTESPEKGSHKFEQKEDSVPGQTSGRFVRRVDKNERKVPHCEFLWLKMCFHKICSEDPFKFSEDHASKIPESREMVQHERSRDSADSNKKSGASAEENEDEVSATLSVAVEFQLTLESFRRKPPSRKISHVSKVLRKRFWTETCSTETFLGCINLYGPDFLLPRQRSWLQLTLETLIGITGLQHVGVLVSSL